MNSDVQVSDRRCWPAVLARHRETKNHNPRILDPRDWRKSAIKIASFRSRSKFGGCPRHLLAERAEMLQTVPQAAVMLTTTTKSRNTVLLASRSISYYGLPNRLHRVTTYCRVPDRTHSLVTTSSELVLRWKCAWQKSHECLRSDQPALHQMKMEYV